MESDIWSEEILVQATQPRQGFSSYGLIAKFI
jgi:hypothetical protein